MIWLDYGSFISFEFDITQIFNIDNIISYMNIDKKMQQNVITPFSEKNIKLKIASKKVSFCIIWTLKFPFFL